STLYGSGGAYEYDPANAIEQIITQKWISMVNFQGLEAHVERKRTGFPDFFETPPGNVTSGLYPQRLPYPSAEIDNNRDELNAVGGQKQVTERVWWNTL
ncbi:MAG: SusD/RagB family nutrient-binding outer membrane lipoprotein, partial [Candidatus Hydrogenedentes bacterium]|nr:SusD/RagB family nutrient-binding outer membrane lipoprotein [Candidatus Hydrogenedentota bacterium]